MQSSFRGHSGCGAVGSASGLGPEGPVFESLYPDIRKTDQKRFLVGLFCLLVLSPHIYIYAWLCRLSFVVSSSLSFNLKLVVFLCSFCGFPRVSDTNSAFLCPFCGFFCVSDTNSAFLCPFLPPMMFLKSEGYEVAVLYGESKHLLHSGIFENRVSLNFECLL